MTKRAIIAARVSTEGQAEHGSSLDTQLKAGRKYAKAHDMEVIAEVIDDCSGTIPIRQRPGGAALYRLIDTRGVDAVIFSTVDRITRDEDLIEISMLRRDVRRAGIELHYCDSGKTDLGTLGGVVDILKAAVAAEERKKIINRNALGRLAKAESGKWVGTGAEPYGYRRNGKGREVGLVICDDEVPVIRRIFYLYTRQDGEKRLSIRAITELLSVEGVKTPARADRSGLPNGQYWSKRTVRIILSQTAYIGQFRYSGRVINIPELAIIDQHTFDMAQERLMANRGQGARNRYNHYLLTGHVRCTCGRAMSGRQRRGKYLYYVCSSEFLPSPGRTCAQKSVRADVLDNAAWQWVMELISSDEAMLAGIERMAQRTTDEMQPKRDRLSQIDEQIDRHTRRIRRWVGEYGDTTTDEEMAALKDQVRETGRLLDALKAERARLDADIQQAAVTDHERESLFQTVRVIRESLADAGDDFESRRYIVERLGLRCALRNGDAGLRADLSIGVESEPVILKPTVPRSALPATPARHCGTRPAPRSPACPSR
ncbi:MAG: recombinase family protein [Chloroflexi bacterium]|nr:recombinase family protein [Chloroflexota bacterium]